jgi:hypothetical protein
MRLNTLEKLYLCLKYELPEIVLSERIIRDGRKCIDRMLDISAKAGLIWYWDIEVLNDIGILVRTPISQYYLMSEECEINWSAFLYRLFWAKRATARKKCFDLLRVSELKFND